LGLDERRTGKSDGAAAKHRKPYNMFGDWHLALASHAAAPDRCELSRSGGVKDCSASARHLPRETRCVPLILAAIVARNPAPMLGRQPPPVEAPNSTNDASCCRRLAARREWAGVGRNDQDLNPELRRWTTPVRAKDYELKVQEVCGSGAGWSADSAQDAATLTWHTVRKGETLFPSRRS
jgi:hypothetical protein